MIIVNLYMMTLKYKSASELISLDRDEGKMVADMSCTVKLWDSQDDACQVLDDA